MKKFLFVLFSFVCVCLLGSADVYAESDYDVIAYDLASGQEKTISYDVIEALDRLTETNGYAPSTRSRSIIGNDDRTLLEDTTQYPYSSIVHITALRKIEWNGMQGVTGSSGSGILINENTVLTAAHCVYSTTDKTWPDSVTVSPGANGNTKPFGSASGVSVEVLRVWKNKIDTGNGPAGYANDIAVIRLDKNIGNETGWLGISENPDKLGKFTITGYPGELGGKMYTHADYFPERISLYEGVYQKNTWENDYINYLLDTTPGNSGSAIYDSQQQVVGVHSSGAGEWNIGTRLYNEKYAVAFYWATNASEDEPMNPKNLPIFINLDVSYNFGAINWPLSSGEYGIISYTALNDGNLEIKNSPLNPTEVALKGILYNENEKIVASGNIEDVAEISYPVKKGEKYYLKFSARDPLASGRAKWGWGIIK